MKDIIDLIARVLLATIFFYEAYDAIFYYADTKREIAALGLIWNPDLLLRTGIFLLTLGAFLLLIGYRVGFGVTLLLLYLIPTTFVVYSFWNAPTDCLTTATCLEEQIPYRRVLGVLFMKNLAIIGGLLMVWVNGSGRWSVKRLFATTKVRL